MDGLTLSEVDDLVQDGDLLLFLQESRVLNPACRHQEAYPARHIDHQRRMGGLPMFVECGLST